MRILTLLLCLCQTALATSWYVRPGVWTTVDGSGHPIPTAGVYGAQDGTSYNDAWNGLTSIVWGGGGVNTGDTIFIAGTHVYRIFSNVGATSQAVTTIGVSGVTIENYPSDPATIFGGAINQHAASTAYQGPDSNGVWFQVLPSGAVPPTFYTNGLIRLKQRTTTTWVDGLGGQFLQGTTNYVKIPGGTGPTTNNMAQESAGWAFDLNGKSNIVFHGISFVSGFSGGADHYAIRFSIPPAPFTAAPKDVIFANCNSRDTRTLYLYPGFDRWIFATNNWGPAGDGPYSLINSQTNAPQQLTFTRNFFHDMDTAEYPSVDGHGIGIQGGSGHIITYNSISNTGPAILLWTGNVAMKNNTIAYNFIQKTHINSQGVSDGIGISGDNALAVFGLRTGNKIYGNVIRNCAVGGGATYQGVGIQCNSADYTEIYNNTIEDVNVGIDWEVAQASSPVSGKVVDNIIDNVASRYFYIAGSASPTNLTVDYNLYSPSGFSSTLTPSTTHDTHSLTNASPHFLVTPPMAQADFGIQGSSPAISNSGVSAGYLTDITGMTIPTGGYNMGAFYQYHVTIPTSCDYLSISNALRHQAQSGDTVDIAAGNCVITNLIQVNRGIAFNIFGQGTNEATRFDANGANGGFDIMSNGSDVFSFGNFSVKNANNQAGWIHIGNAGTLFGGPIHLYNIAFTNAIGGRLVSGGAGDSFGLAEFIYGKSASGGGVQFIDFQGNGYSSWATANPLGTTNAFCVERCAFDNTGGFGNGFFDMYIGAQGVFRFNSCDGPSLAGTHGYDSSVISPRTWEIYGNTFTNCNTASAVAIRGGTGVFATNKAYGTTPVLSYVTYYRACNQFTSAHLVEGIPGQAYILNFSGYTNYPDWTFNSYGATITNGEHITAGFTSYYFVTNLSAATFNMGNNGGFGGGAVLIGATTEDSISNLFLAINLDHGLNTVYTNPAAGPFKIGHEFIAISFNSTNLYLTNALDGNTDAFGYPANQQTGVITSFPLTGTNFVNVQDLQPAYAWGNTLNGSPQQFTSGSETLCGGNLTNLVKLDRDYFNDIPMPGWTALQFPHPLSIAPGTNTPPAPTGFRFLQAGIKRRGF